MLVFFLSFFFFLLQEFVAHHTCFRLGSFTRNYIPFYDDPDAKCKRCWNISSQLYITFVSVCVMQERRMRYRRGPLNLSFWFFILHTTSRKHVNAECECRR